ncbi:Similar to dj-1beta: Protein dj-1beta (Drosophila melanogaster), partial [Cotesia congregata]
LYYIYICIQLYKIHAYINYFLTRIYFIRLYLFQLMVHVRIRGSTTSTKLLSSFYLSKKLFTTFAMAKKTAILLMADGAEEMEAVITADVLRRAGIDVTIASITGNDCIKCSRDVKICADTQLDAVKNNSFDAVILPGGLGGSKALASSKEVGELLKKQESEGRVIAAICAAPTALKAHGIAPGKQVTSYPAMKDQLVNYYKYLEDIVVTDGENYLIILGTLSRAEDRRLRMPLD